MELPVPYYAGTVRNSDPEFPELYGYEVGVGAFLGLPSAEVPVALARFEDAMERAVGVLDPVIAPEATAEESGHLASVLLLCAHAHGEWVRIHPFANGNGRTARLWVNWCALRYGLPPFLRLIPRPGGDLYTRAAAFSMQGNDQAMVFALGALLDERLAEGR